MNAPGWLTALDSLGFVTSGIFLSLIWQSSIVFISVGLIILFIKRVRESIKYCFWLTAILIVPVIPVLTWGLSQIGTPQKEIAVIPKYNIEYSVDETIPAHNHSSSSPFTQKGISPDIPQDQDVIYNPDNPVLPVKEPVVNKIKYLNYPWALIFLLYIVSLILFLAYFLIGRATIEKWILNGSPVLDEDVITLFDGLKEKLGIKREIILIENDVVTIPLTCRTIKPVIILPPGFASKISGEDLAAVFLHELAHIKRYDTFSNTIVSVIRAMFFFHPFVWFAAKEAQILADKACDSMVIDITEKPVSYAKMLTYIARNFTYKSFNTEHAAGFLFKRSTFLRRVESILSGRENQIKKVSKIGTLFISSFAMISLFVSLAIPLAEVDYSTGNPVTISGNVFSGEKPVENATIYVAINNDYLNKNNSVVKIAKTSKDGSFSFKIDSYTLNGENFHNKPVIFVYSPEYAIGWKKLNDNVLLKNIRIELAEMTSLSGVVEDPDGKPFKGAGIEIYSLINKNCPSKEVIYSISNIIKTLKCTTDENGAFTITNLPPNSDVCLNTHVEGYYADFYPPMVDSGEKNLHVNLRKGGQISGKITFGDNGKPAVGIYVRCEGWYGIDDVRTNRDGEYIFNDIKPGEYSVCIFQKKEFPEWAPDIKNNVPVESNNLTGNVDFKLVRGGIVTGKITDAGNGKPIPGINVIAEPLDMYRVIHLDFCKTDKNGNYRLRVPPGKIQIRTDFAEDYQKSSNTSLLEVKDGENLQGNDFTFKMGLSLTAVALSPEGKPVPGTSLVKPGNPHSSTFITDNKGTCIFRGLTKGEKLSIYAENSKLNLRGTGTVEIGNSSRFEIKMDKYETFSIGGHVFDSGGNPLRHIRFKLIDEKVIPSTMTNTGVSDNDGFYVIKNLIKGNKYGLFTESDTYSQVQIPIDRISKGEIGKPGKQPGEPEYIYDIYLDKAERWMEGSIKDNLGNPVCGARVSNFNGPGMVQTISGNDGHYRLDNLSFLVEAEIQVTHPEYGHYRFKLIPTNTKQNFTLTKKEESIKGRIVDKDGKPAAGVIYRFEPGNPKSGMTQSGGMTDSEGHFLIDKVIGKEIKMSFDRDNENFKNLKVKSGSGDVTLVMKKADVSEAKKMDNRKQPVLIDGNPPELAVSEWINCSPVKIGNLKGKTVILNFWSCEDDYSLKKLKALNIIQQAYESQGVVIISIHENTKNIRNAEKTIKDLKVNHFAAVDNKGNHEFSNGETFDRYGKFRYSNGTQYAFCTVIDSKGKIHQRIHFLELENVLKESIRNGK